MAAKMPVEIGVGVGFKRGSNGIQTGFGLAFVDIEP